MMQLTELSKGRKGYPKRLIEHMGKRAPKLIWVLGETSLLDQELLALFCSVRCPGDEILKLYDAARALRDTGVGVVSGFHTPMEKECLITLLRGNQPIVICPPRSLQRMRVPAEWKDGIEAGRIALVSSHPEAVSRASRATSAVRNGLVAALATEVLIAHAEPKGQTEELAGELKAARRTPLDLNTLANHKALKV